MKKRTASQAEAIMKDTLFGIVYTAMGLLCIIGSLISGDIGWYTLVCIAIGVLLLWAAYDCFKNVKGNW